MNNSTKNILALSLIKGVGSAFIKKKLSVLTLYANDIDMLSFIGGKINHQSISANFEKADNIIAECKTLGIKIITIVDDAYPKNLLEIKDPPPVLYTKGNLGNLNRVIAIVGTRDATPLGEKIANKTGNYFSENWSICNGLVNGIDKHSIMNKNECSANVIGVLSGGLNFEKTSSKMTGELAEAVLKKDGLLISEHEPNKEEDQFTDSKVNRIQGGLSHALILIQSSKTGSAKYAIKTFSETKRPLGIIKFQGNKEYESGEIFGGNRLILEKGKEGIAEMCKIKTVANIKTQSIIELSKKEDYLKL